MEESSTPSQTNNAQEEVPMRLIKIKTLSDTTYELKVPANIIYNQQLKKMLVKDLKIKVQELSGVPHDRQRMICQGQQLQDSKLVSDYAKEPEQPNWIHLVAKVQGTQESNQNSGQQQTQNQNSQQQQPQQQGPRNTGNIGMLGETFQALNNNMGEISQLLGNIRSVFNLGNGQQQVQNPQNQSQVSNQSLSSTQPSQSQQVANSNIVSNSQNQVNSQPQQRSNLIGSQQPITIQRQIQLPHQELLDLGLRCNSLMGPGSSFPGPPLPIIPNRQSAALIGSYLSNWYFQVQRVLPFVHRLSQLLQREIYMNVPEDRSSTQALSIEVGHALNDLVACTEPIADILLDLQLNQLPGTVRIEQNSNAPTPVLTRPPPQHPMQQNIQTTQSSNNFVSANIQSVSNISQNMNQPTVQQSRVLNSTPPLASQNQPIINNTLNNQTQSSQLPQATISISTNANNNSINLLNNLISQRGGVPNGSIRMGVNNQNSGNNPQVQIVGIGQTQIVGADPNTNLQSLLSNIIGQGGTQNTNNQTQNNQSSNTQQNQFNNIQFDQNSPQSIEISSIINVDGTNVDNNLVQSLLSGLGLTNANMNTNINLSNNRNTDVNQSSIPSSTISGSQNQNQFNSQQPSRTNNQQQQQQVQQQVNSQQGFMNNTNSNNVPLQQQHPQPQMQNPFMMMNGDNNSFNPLSMLMGGGLGGMMTMTVNELIRENMSSSEDEEDEEQSEVDDLILAIIGESRASDFIQGFMSKYNL